MIDFKRNGGKFLYTIKNMKNMKNKNIVLLSMLCLASSFNVNAEEYKILFNKTAKPFVVASESGGEQVVASENIITVETLNHSNGAIYNGYWVTGSPFLGSINNATLSEFPEINIINTAVGYMVGVSGFPKDYIFQLSVDSLVEKNFASLVKVSEILSLIPANANSHYQDASGGGSTHYWWEITQSQYNILSNRVNFTVEVSN